MDGFAKFEQRNKNQIITNLIQETVHFIKIDE